MTRERSKGQPAFTARLAAGGALALLIGAMTAIIVTADDAGDDTRQRVTATTTVTAVTKRKPAPPKTRRVVVTAVGAYDPEGDQSENDGAAPLAADGNTVSAWKSERYRRSFAKTGVGLVLDAGKPITATRVVVVTDTPGYKAEVRVGDTAEGAVLAGARKRPRRPRERSSHYAHPRPLSAALDHVDATLRSSGRERDHRDGEAVVRTLAVRWYARPN